MRASLLILLAALYSYDLAHARDTVIDFEKIDPGEKISSDQYAAEGLAFDSSWWLPYGIQVSPGTTSSGTGAAGIGCAPSCSTEFWVAGMRGVFTETTQRTVEVDVGQLGDGGLYPTKAAEVMLTAFDASGKPISKDAATLILGQGIHAHLKVGSKSDNIASFTIAARANDDTNKVIAIDDLKFSGPDAPLAPDFTISANPAIITVLQSKSTPVDVAINRLNGSTGNVTLSVYGLPAGVGVAINPAVVSGNSSTITFMGSASAPPNSASTPVTISAIPVAGAGPAEKTISVLVNVRANFEVLAALDAANKPAEIVGCADYTMGLRIIRDFGFKGVVTLEAVNLPAGVHANFKRSQIDFSTSGNAQEETEVTFSVDPGVSFPLASAGANPPQIVGKSAGAPASILPVALSASLTKINGFSPAQGWTPREFKPGDEVTISGQGFCGDAFVAFGNGYSKAHPTWVSDDATQMELRVHRLATTGPLALSMEEDPASTPMVTSAAPFTVFSYRNRSGYSFRNPHNIDVSFSDVDELFGYEQTHLSIDFCWPFGCSVATPIPSPLAAIFTGIARGALNDGQCFGMGLSSQRILHGQKPISDFPPAGATSLYELIGPNAGALPSSGTIGQGEKLLHYVHVQHIAQLSSEYLHHWIGQAALNLSQPSGHIRLQVMDALSAGDHPLISLRHGGKGHVVVAYNLEDDGMGTGGFFIDVYDPNEPFVNGENAANGELHKDREGFLDPATSEEIGGRVHIFPNGTWRFPHSSKTNPWEGGLDTLVVARSSVVPLTPTMPASFDGLITLIFGEAAGTTQILDGSGRFALNSKGEINRDPASAISGAHRFAIAAAEDSDSDIYILPGSGTYVQSITGKAKGPYTAASISLKGSTRLTTDTRAGASDEVKRLPDVAGLDFRSAGAPRPYEAEVATMARDSSQRRIKLTSTTSKAGDSIAFDAAAEHIVYDHRGPPAAYTFTLEWAGQSASPASFVSPSLRVRKGDHVTIAPSNWQDLSSQPVAVTVVSASGKSETVSLPIAPQISGITIKRVISDRKGFDRRIGLESEFASATAPTDLVYVSWNMLRNGKSIGRHVEQINQLIEAGGSRTDFWTAPSEIHGVVQIDASVTLIRQNEVLSSETARLSRQVKLD